MRRAAVRRDQLVDARLGGFLDVAADDLRPLAREQARGGAADTAVGAGDDRHFAAQSAQAGAQSRMLVVLAHLINPSARYLPYSCFKNPEDSSSWTKLMSTNDLGSAAAAFGFVRARSSRDVLTPSGSGEGASRKIGASLRQARSRL